jgi:hypothetical protein
MASTGFFSLSQELICSILKQLRFGDIYAIIQTSSHLYRTFVASRNNILWDLARTSMEPEVLVEAVTAVKLRNIQCDVDFGLEFNEISSRAKEISKEGGRNSVLPDMMSSTDLTMLCQFHLAVEYFIVDYGIQEASNSLSSFNDSTSDLSSSLLTRLQRAFYRYDICQTMSYHPGRLDHPLDYGALFCASNLLFKVDTEWEVEEIAAIWLYMYVKMVNVLEDHEKEPIQMVGGPAISGSISVLHTTFLSSRTLPSLRAFFQSSLDQQRQLLLPVQISSPDQQDRVGEFLPYSLRKRPVGLYDSRSHVVFRSEEDMLPDLNMAWLCRQELRGFEYCDLPCKSNHQDGGPGLGERGALSRPRMIDECKYTVK